MKKLAIVVQRYGNEVNGGAEYHAKILAEKLAEQYNIDIITTTALDYKNWENHYSNGLEIVNGINVLRFPTINKRSRTTRVARRALLRKKKYFKLLKVFNLFNFLEKKFKISSVKEKHIENWINGQGPYCPELLDYIETNKNKYSAFIFFTYLYYPTIKGMPLVAEKSIFIPTAHNEALLFTKAYENIFNVPKFIMYNTDCEKNLIENNFSKYTKNADVAGIGIEKYTGLIDELPKELHPKKYFVYIGRINAAKGCEQMIKYFTAFIKRNPKYKDCKLVLVGKNYIKLKPHPNIIYAGFVNDSLKYSLLKNSIAMIMPSFFESLSLVTLEAMIEEIPVIVNKKCEVLYNHIIKSNTGAAYNNEDSFSKILKDYINKSPENLIQEGKLAQEYVLENYQWNTILDKFQKAIKMITEN